MAEACTAVTGAPHIVYLATPHGFGHAAIVTAVMAAVAARFPHIRQTIVTQVPEGVLRDRLSGSYAYCSDVCATDFGICMSSSTGILLPQTLERYHAAHQYLAAHLARRKTVLAALRPSLIVASASYSAIAAAAALGVPAVTVGPFLWHDILQAYAPGAETLLSEMAGLYQRATGFVLTTPFVAPTVAGPARHVVGPVGLVGQCHRADLMKMGGIRQGERIVFASLGGINESVPYSGWRCPDGWRLLTQEDAQRYGLRISDLIASSAAVVTKPGYGTYIEAAHAGASLISRARPDWPESAGLLEWYRQQGLPVHEVSEESFAGAGPLSVLPDGPDIRQGHPVVGQRFTPGAEQCADLLVGQYL